MWRLPTPAGRLILLVMSILLPCLPVLADNPSRLDKIPAEEFSRIKQDKGVVLLAVNWNRRWNCGGYQNAQLRGIGFDRLPSTPRGDDAPADLTIAEAPLILTTPGFDTYVFIVDPGDWAMSEFEVKVAKSMADVRIREAHRSQLIKDGKAEAGSFDVHAGEAVYIGHFYLDCYKQPIPWRFYSDGPDEFKKYLASIAGKFPLLSTDTVQYRPLTTIDFGNDILLEAGLKAEASKDWQAAERSFEEDWVQWSTAISPDAERSMAMYNLGRIKGYLCKFPEAERLLTESLSLEEKISGPESSLTSKRVLEIGRFYFDRGQADKASAYLARGLPLLAKLGVERDDPITMADLYDDFSVALTSVGDARGAQAAKDEAARIRADHPNQSAKFKPVRYSRSCSAS
jgi:hypothetical protein